MFLRKFVINAAAIAAISASSTVLADDMANADSAVLPSNNSGLYLRGQLGYGFVDGQYASSNAAVNQATNNIFKTAKKSDGLTGRVAAGYNFNQFFGLETGFALFQPYYRNIGPVAGTMNGLPGIVSGPQTRTSLYAIDLLGRATIPVRNFFAFVEGGAAYVHANYRAASAKFVSTGVTPITVNSTLWNAGSTGYIRPKAGVGVGYNINDNVAIDVSYDRIFHVGNDPKNAKGVASYVPNINTAMVGLTYKF